MRRAKPGGRPALEGPDKQSQPHRRLRPPRDRPHLVEHTLRSIGPSGPLKEPADEAEIGRRVDQREEHARRGWLGDDLFDPRDGKYPREFLTLLDSRSTIQSPMQGSCAAEEIAGN